MTGLIAFFDILGYQSFCTNSKEPIRIQTVLHWNALVPSAVRDNVRNYILDSKASDNRAEREEVAKELQHLVFSDTIVIFIKFPEKLSPTWRDIAVSALILASAEITRAMFAYGLPVRGVIHEGEFYHHEHCLAGNELIAAYKNCARLDFSGTTLSPKLSIYLEECQSRSKPLFSHTQFGALFVTILTPLKDGKEEKMTHLNWLNLVDFANKQRLALDITKDVMRSFSAHNKDCGRDVDGKITNTSKIIRQLMLAREAWEAQTGGPRPSLPLQ